MDSEIDNGDNQLVFQDTEIEPSKPSTNKFKEAPLI